MGLGSYGLPRRVRGNSRRASSRPTASVKASRSLSDGNSASYTEATTRALDLDAQTGGAAQDVAGILEANRQGPQMWYVCRRMERLVSALNSPLLLYVAAVALLGLYCLFRLFVWLGRAERLRIGRLRRRQSVESIPTHSPVDDALAVAKARGVESIERHATVIRRLVLPLVVVAFALLGLLPFLSKAPATAVTLLAAAVTVVLGIAARPLIENAMSGLVIAFSKLINIGDTVSIDEHYGTVEDITVTHTTLKLWDWRRYVVPNSRMIAASLLNYSVFDKYYWACVEFWVSYATDIDQVRAIAVSIPSRSEHFSAHEPPAFWLMDLEQHGIRCWLAAWANSPSDGWLLKHEMRQELVRELREAGIATHLQRHQLERESSVRGDG